MKILGNYVRATRTRALLAATIMGGLLVLAAPAAKAGVIQTVADAVGTNPSFQAEMAYVGGNTNKIRTMQAALPALPMPASVGAQPLLPPMSDTGLPTDLYQIQTDLVNDVNNAAGALEGTTPPSNLFGLLSQSYSATVMSAKLADVTDTWSYIQGLPDYTPLDGHNFLVDEWQGTQVAGTWARVILRGHMSSLGAGSWSDDAIAQWHYVLAKEEGIWKIVMEYRVPEWAAGTGDIASDGAPGPPVIIDPMTNTDLSPVQPPSASVDPLGVPQEVGCPPMPHVWCFPPA